MAARHNDHVSRHIATRSSTSGPATKSPSPKAPAAGSRLQAPEGHRVRRQLSSRHRLAGLLAHMRSIRTRAAPLVGRRKRTTLWSRRWSRRTHWRHRSRRRGRLITGSKRCGAQQDSAYCGQPAEMLHTIGPDVAPHGTTPIAGSSARTRSYEDQSPGGAIAERGLAGIGEPPTGRHADESLVWRPATNGLCRPEH